jgi:serine/threonine-protein kinase
MGDSAACARQVREAYRMTPSSAEVNDLLGRILIEAGRIERGLAILNTVLALEPDRMLVAREILRARALLGDWSAFEAAVEAQVGDERATTHYSQLCRLAMWRRDRVAAAVLRRQIGARGFPMAEESLGMLDIVEHERTQVDLARNVAGLSGVVGRARRRPIYFRQLATEGLACMGEYPRAEATLVEAGSLGLVDLGWLDRCPLLEPMRSSPSFTAVRTSVTLRATEVLDILDGSID